MKKFLTLALLLTGCSQDIKKEGSQQPQMPPVPVKTASIEVRDVPLHFEALGTLKPNKVAEIKPQVSGMITQVHFLEGEWVDEGTLLYSIEEAPYAIKVQESEAQLAQNLAHLKNAEKKRERYLSLSNKDLISPLEWDELETKVALCAALLKADEARLSGAKLDHSHCHIYAPFSGKTGKTSLQEGNIVSMGTPLVTILKTDVLYADFCITERELEMITSATPEVEVYPAGSDELLARGSLTFLDHAIDSRTGMMTARALMEKSLRPAFPGQSVRVHIFTGKKIGARLIPLRAIKTGQTGPYVFSVKEDNTVETRPVKLGAEQNGFIIVEEGLEDAWRVITEGHLRLFPGSSIEETPS